MKSNKKLKPRSRKKSAQKSLEHHYQTVFAAPISPLPLRERLSMYKSVPSVTTYGAYEKPI